MIKAVSHQEKRLLFLLSLVTLVRLSFSGAALVRGGVQRLVYFLCYIFLQTVVFLTLSKTDIKSTVERFINNINP